MHLLFGNCKRFDGVIEDLNKLVIGPKKKTYEKFYNLSLTFFI